MTSDLTNSPRVGHLRVTFCSVHSQAFGHVVETKFLEDSSISGITIVDNDTLSGMIPRQWFFALMAKPYNPELYMKRPASHLLDKRQCLPMVIAAEETVLAAASSALARPDGQTGDPVVVTFPGNRFAVLDQQILLRSMADVLDKQRQQATELLDELRSTQSQLIQSEQMASLGGLVAGVAHEINTPIGIVLATASHFAALTEQFQQNLDQGKMRKSDLEGYTAQAHQAATLLTLNASRAAKLIESFKQVSVDRTSDERRNFQLKEYLNEIMTSLSPKLKGQPITVSITCPDDIQCDSYPGALSQIITNLVINSLVHGFDDGRAGTISIQAKLGAKDHVQLDYRDDGKGIPAEHIPRVFDPFFTTKRNVGGSGLGMHITYNLATGPLGGSIHLTSTIDQGVTINLRFPRIANPHTSAPIN